MNYTKQLLLSNNYWVLNKTIVKKLGIETAFFLSNLAEAEKLSDEEGWFYQTIDTVEEITTLSRRKQDSAVEKLKETGILELKIKGMPKKRYFKLNYKNIEKYIFSCTQLSVQNVQNGVSETYTIECAKRTTSKELNNKEINKEINIYSVVFNHYLSKDNLIKHKTLTIPMKKAIDTAIKNYKLDLDYLKRIIDRHSEKIELNKIKTEFKLKARSLSELFGQKKYQSQDLICADYLDEAYEIQKVIKAKTYNKNSIALKTKEQKELEDLLNEKM